jgi:lipopolysaccharide export system permease protein
MRLLDHYIRNTVISATLVVLLALAGVQSFMELVSELSNIGKGHFTLWSVLITVPLRLPSDLYVFFPVAGFLGCLLGMGRLASTSQLIVMRSSGVSIPRISWAVIKASLILIVFMTLVGEWIGPILQNKADHIQQMALGHQDDKRTQDIWLHQKNRFVHIDAVSSVSEMKGISVFKFDSQGQLLSAINAPLALKKNKQWYLEGSKKTVFSSNALQVEKAASVALPIVFDAELVLNSHDNIQGDSIKELVKDIAYREHSGLLANQYELSFWQRILQPFTTVVMIALGIPFIFGSLRSSSMGLRMLVGVIIGFAFYMLNRLFGPITIVYQFPPLLAALTPTMLFLLAYGILIRRI